MMIRNRIVRHNDLRVYASLFVTAQMARIHLFEYEKLYNCGCIILKTDTIHICNLTIKQLCKYLMILVVDLVLWGKFAN